MTAEKIAAKDAPMTTTTPLRIAVLGIGMMGLPMARRLCAAGHQVHISGGFADSRILQPKNGSWMRPPVP